MAAIVVNSPLLATGRGANVKGYKNVQLTRTFTEVPRPGFHAAQGGGNKTTGRREDWRESMGGNRGSGSGVVAVASQTGTPQEIGDLTKPSAVATILAITENRKAPTPIGANCQSVSEVHHD